MMLQASIQKRSHNPALHENPDRAITAQDHTRIAGVDAMGAALAHELNQPLAALSIYLRSLQKISASFSGDTAPLARDLVAKALRETARTSDIVRRMRRFTACGEPDRQMVDINAIAEESIDVALPGNNPRIMVERNFAADLPMVSGDPNQIRQIMINLLRNALEATGDSQPPRIAVTTQDGGGMVHITVADNGPGIDARIVGRLFKAFETSKPQGMGLGLAISRIIAQNHGGDLILEKDSRGAGACFGLRLPVR